MILGIVAVFLGTLILERLTLKNDYINYSINSDQIDVGKIEKIVNSFNLVEYYNVTSSDGSIVATYNVQLFDYASKFLDRDVTYSLVSYKGYDAYTCVAKSLKGAGIIAPVKTK